MSEALDARGAAGSAIVAADVAAIETAAEHLRAGDLVAFPTETVYGLGANATDDAAVAAIFRTKGRPLENPLIVHVADAAAAAALVVMDARATAAAAAFWPGPLTLVLDRAEDCPVSGLVSAGLPTLAVRAPDHAVAQAVLHASGLPLAAPSANPSGRLSPTTAAHVAEGLGDAVALILDGGRCAVGIESTVLALDREVATILRPGAVTEASIAKVLGAPVQIMDGGGADVTSGPARSPGTRASHYAPAAALRLHAETVGPTEGLLAFGAAEPAGGRITRNLSRSGDLAEAAGSFYACLRELDRAGVDVIAVVPIPEAGLGAAINDRLRRAAAPRV